MLISTLVEMSNNISAIAGKSFVAYILQCIKSERFPGLVQFVIADFSRLILIKGLNVNHPMLSTLGSYVNKWVVFTLKRDERSLKDMFKPPGDINKYPHPALAFAACDTIIPVSDLDDTTPINHLQIQSFPIGSLAFLPNFTIGVPCPPIVIRRALPNNGLGGTVAVAFLRPQKEQMATNLSLSASFSVSLPVYFECNDQITLPSCSQFVLLQGALAKIQEGKLVLCSNREKTTTITEISFDDAVKHLQALVALCNQNANPVPPPAAAAGAGIQ